MIARLATICFARYPSALYTVAYQHTARGSSYTQVTQKNFHAHACTFYNCSFAYYSYSGNMIVNVSVSARDNGTREPDGNSTHSQPPLLFSSMSALPLIIAFHKVRIINFALLEDRQRQGLFERTALTHLSHNFVVIRR